MNLYLDGADRARLDHSLDRCVAVYLKDLEEDGQVRFKGRAKAFRARVRDPAPRPSPTTTWAGRTARSS